MTAMAGSGAPTATEQRFVARFGRTERTLHWVHAVAFVVMFASGMVLYLPALSRVVADRPVAKAVHLVTAVAWLACLALIGLLGNRRALAADVGELERFDDDDLRWLRGRRAPQGRFNAGQKAHTIVQAALAVLLTISGVLLWLGERNTRLRFQGTITLHDVATYVAAALVVGHVYLAVVHPSTRPSLRGIVRGSVNAAWARIHHPKWRPGAQPRSDPPTAWTLAGVVAVLALAAVGIGIVLGSS
jgi:formate dehydrogenase subunit gamma